MHGHAPAIRAPGRCAWVPRRTGGARASLYPYQRERFSGARTDDGVQWEPPGAAATGIWTVLAPYRLPIVKRRIGRVAMSGVRVTGRPRARFTAERAGPGRVLLIGLVALLALLGACQQPARPAAPAPP